MAKSKKMFIDSAKGIGIILVVIGHLLYKSKVINGNVHTFIYSFHVPLFFIVSGYLNKSIEKGYLKKKTLRLLLPFLCFTFVGIPIFGPKLYNEGLSVGEIFLNFIYKDGLIVNNPLWFLIVLYEIHLINYFIKLPNRNKRTQIIVFAIFVLLGYLVFLGCKISALSYFGFNRTIICYAFFTFGVIINSQHLKLDSILIFIFSLAINLIFGLCLNEKVSIYGFFIKNYIPFIIAGIFGSIAMLSLCKMFLDKENIFSKYSKYSILFLGTQFYWIVPLDDNIKYWNFSNQFLNKYKFDIISTIIFVVYIWLTPKIYELLKSKFKSIKYFNGEI